MKDKKEAQKIEKEYMDSIRDKHPELLEAVRKLDTNQTLRHIGIEIDRAVLPQGYINLYPQDFIVEEIDTAGHLHAVELGDQNILERSEDKKTLYADMVKIGVSTFEAKQIIADHINASLNTILHAGLKDKVAITCQQLSFTKFDLEKLRSMKLPSIFLKNFVWGKGALFRGGNFGNRFTLVIRTPTTMGERWLKRMISKLGGSFYNFYYEQRFGTPRLLSHMIGKSIFQKDFKQAVFIFLCENGVNTFRLHSEIRQEAKKFFGNWQKMIDIFEKLPNTFGIELELCEHLNKNPDDFSGALRVIRNQAEIWMHAYISYLFNLHLSHLIKNKQTIPDSLSIDLNRSGLEIPTFRQKLAQSKIQDLVSPFKTIVGMVPNLEKKPVKTRQQVKIHHSKIVPNAVILCFDLPTGSYATTFLSHLFSVNRGWPHPEWLDRTIYDSKQILGLGSITELQEKFGDFMQKLDEVPS